MKGKLYTILALLIMIGCSNTPNVPKKVSLATWEDSVSYSLGSDVGATLKDRKMYFDSEPLFDGFQRTYAGDSSYVLGASIAASYKGQMIEVEPKIFLRAVATTFAGDSTLLSLDEMKTVVRRYDTELRESRVLEQKMKGEKNRIEGERFAEEYQKNEDVIVLESGLMYRVLNEGFGDSPSADNTVVVHYTGKLLNGEVFDSSVDRGEPATFRVGGVIQGWQEALQLMKVGSKWELVIPANLAYGERGSGSIPSNSTLIFDVELLGIE